MIKVMSMKKFYKIVILFVLIFLNIDLIAQTPQYSFANGTTGSNSIPWGGGSWADQRNQWFWAPGDFGNTIYNGLITKIYFKAGTIGNATTWTNLKISLGQPNITGLTTAWETGLTQVYFSASHYQAAVSVDQWFSITLQTPFLFDPTKPLVMETIQTGTSGGIALRAGGTPINPSYSGNTQTYGASSASSGTTRRYSYALGLDLMPASGFDLAMSAIKSPAVFNVGNNYLTVTVQNKRVDTIKWFDIAYQLGNNTPIVITNHYPSSPVLSGKTYDYTFSTPINIATAGTYSLKTWIANTNDSTPDNDKTNDTIKTTFCTGMSGTYTIGGTGADYPNFTSAVDAIKTCGVAGPITFNVNAGTYNERVSIPSIPGTSKTSQVKFLGSGASSCKITYAGTSTAYSTIFLNGADWFTFDGFTIENTGTSYGVGVTISNSADNNTISNNIITVPQNVSSSYFICVRMGNGDGSSGAGNFGVGNTIYKNSLIGGYYGMYIYGGGSSTGARIDYNTTVSNNTFTNQYTYGCYIYYSGHTKFIYNKMSNFYSVSAYGLMHYYGGGDTTMSNNIQAGLYGIYYYYGNYNGVNAGWKSLIANNFIYNMTYALTYYTRPIYCYYSYYTTITNNTIWTGNKNTSYNTYSYPLLSMYYSYYCEAYNNILVNDGYSFFLSCYYAYYCKVDYNLYYNTPTAFGGNPSSYYQFCYYPTASTTLSNFTSFSSYQSDATYLGTHDKNSLPQYDPKLNSYLDLHHISGFKGYLGNFIPGLTHDIDGDIRCVFQTYFGADGPFHAAPNVGFIASDTVCQNTPVTFFNTSSNKDPYNVKWYIDNVQKGTNYHYSHTFTSTGSYQVKMAFQSCVRTDTFSKDVISIVPYKAPLSEFMVSKNIIESGEAVTLYDFSDRCPDSWTWEITPAKVIDPNTNQMSDAYTFLNGTGVNSQNPELKFNYPGPYTVSLTSSNVIGTSAKTTKVDYINVKLSVSLCGLYSETSQRYGTLYDDGGSSNYGSKKSCNYLIKSCGKEIDLAFVEFNLGDKSYLRIYDGFNSTGQPMWNTTKYPLGITGGMNNPNFDTFFKATRSGMVYIEFESDLVTAPGFKLDWSTTGSQTMLAPVAAFNSEDTGCVVLPMNLENISIADFEVTRFKWDYDGNGIIDAYTTHGKFGPISFPGLYAMYKTKLIAENCGGSDTAESTIILTNPQKNPDAEPMATVTRPVINQDATILYVKENSLSCVDKVEWQISPNNYYYTNGTDKYSLNPQVVFTKVDSFDVTVIMGNSNTPFSSTTSKTDYIIPIEYCQPAVALQHADIGISHVKVGSIDNYTMIGQSGYTNYSNTHSTELTADKTFDIVIERNTNYNNVYVRVWIDYNIDGVFDDASERVVSIDNSSLIKWDTSFHVPMNVTIGAMTMRVGVGYAGKSDPCGPFKYGEFEDYRIFMSPDNEPPVITILGNNPEYIEQGTSYTDAGATAMDNQMGNVTKSIKTVNNVNTKVVGNYMVSYDVCDSLNNCASTATRLVVVTKDKTPPVITLMGGDPLYFNVYDAFVDVNYTAYDLVDGDLTSKVIVSHNVDVNTLGSYTATYTVTDAAGLSDTKQRGVVVKDVGAPDISLNGDAVMYHEIMTPFTDPGVNYSDNYWPLNKIIYDKTGVVDTTKIGVYELTYSVTDFSGNGPNTVKRTVIVYDSTAPVANLTGEEEVVLQVNEPWYDPGVQVSDNSLKGFVYEITGSFYSSFPPVNGKFIPNKIGLYTIFYLVKDEAGNSSEMVPRVVKVVDTKCPELALKGDIMLSVEKWSNYTDAGYTLQDNYYATKEIKVDTINTVNTHYPGLYFVQYTATDPSNNNCVSVTRMVRVVYNNVGIEESGSGKVSVYPNPTSGRFTIKVDMNQGVNARISIINLIGEEVKVVNNGTLLTDQYEVDMSAYASGIYMVKVQTATVTTLEKLILTK